MPLPTQIAGLEDERCTLLASTLAGAGSCCLSEVTTTAVLGGDDAFTRAGYVLCVMLAASPGRR